jgi:pimeloyl-ACP methyl ester carboxylesterase
MLANRPELFSEAILVAPFGLRPSDGVIYDQFLVSSEVYARKAFHDQSNFDQSFGPVPPYEQLEAWEDDREMTCRLAWKPYMYHPSLAKMMATVATQVTVVHGEDDAIIPINASRMFCDALQKASLKVIPKCGHAVDLECPEVLSKVLHPAALVK